jgi:hypothetical protein
MNNFTLAIGFWLYIVFVCLCTVLAIAASIAVPCLILYFCYFLCCVH